jgi:hypothetical protein
MDTPTKNIDLTAIIGRQVQVLNLHRWGGQIIFTEKDPTIEIDFDADLVFYDTNDHETHIEDLQTGGGLLCTLFGAVVEKAEWHEERELTLFMSTGSKLKIANTGYIDINGVPAIPGDKVIRSSN